MAFPYACSFSGRFSFRAQYDISLTELCALPVGGGGWFGTTVA